MLGLFKKSDPTVAKQKKYQKLLEEAMNLQRNGDIQSYAKKMEEAERISKEIEEMKA